MRTSDRLTGRELFFRISISLKGVHAALEIVGGLALLLVTPGFLLRIVASLTPDEFDEAEHGFLANHIHHLLSGLSLSHKQFAAWYLLSHGVVKLALVAALLKRKLWAYPAGLAIFAAFIIYQVYLFTRGHSVGVAALTIFDLFVIGLIWLEYRALLRQTSLAGIGARAAGLARSFGRDDRAA